MKKTLIFDELTQIDEKHSTLRNLILTSGFKESSEYSLMLLDMYEHMRNKRKNIGIMFDRYKDLDNEKIYKILKVRNRILQRAIDMFGEDKLGTCFNITAHVYHDIYMDVKRNRKTLRIYK